MAGAVALHRVERLGAREEQQGVKFERTLGAPLQRRPGRIEVVAEVAVQLVAGLLRHLRFRLAPQRGTVVGGLILAVACHRDRQGDVVGPLADCRLQPVRLQVLVGVRLHVQHDGGARRVALGRRQRVVAAPVRRPEPGRAIAARLARRHLHPVGHHERGVEPHAELADERRLLVGGALERAGEGAGAGARDGAEILRQLLPRHADALVLDGQRARLLVRQHPHARALRQAERRIGQRLEPPPVGGVRRVGHQLAQKNFALGVEGVNDKIEQSPDFCAELVPFGGGCVWGGGFAHRARVLLSARVGEGRSPKQASQSVLRSCAVRKCAR